ncbi:hypothetical protein BJ742DRAFT_879883 [Cladochytrium replicatum]|nr:hypothetical protein BJ742DRAFT_879883 [Cladochytrium replicatum]
MYSVLPFFSAQLKTIVELIVAEYCTLQRTGHALDIGGWGSELNPLLRRKHSISENLGDLHLNGTNTRFNWINEPNDVDGQTTLHIASKLGRSDILKLMFETHIFDDPLPDSGGKTAADLASNEQAAESKTGHLKRMSLDSLPTKAVLKNPAGEDTTAALAPPAKLDEIMPSRPSLAASEASGASLSKMRATNLGDEDEDEFYDAFDKSPKMPIAATRRRCLGSRFTTQKMMTKLYNRGAYFDSAHGALEKAVAKALFVSADDLAESMNGYAPFSQACTRLPLDPSVPFDIRACHCESSDYLFWTEVNFKSSSGGRALQFIPWGHAMSDFVYTVRARGNVIRSEHYSWRKVTTCLTNLIVRQDVWIDHFVDLTCRDWWTGRRGHPDVQAKVRLWMVQLGEGGSGGGEDSSSSLESADSEIVGVVNDNTG